MIAILFEWNHKMFIFYYQNEIERVFYPENPLYLHNYDKEYNFKSCKVMSHNVNSYKIMFYKSFIITVWSYKNNSNKIRYFNQLTLII